MGMGISEELEGSNLPKEREQVSAVALIVHEVASPVEKIRDGIIKLIQFYYQLFLLFTNVCAVLYQIKGKQWRFAQNSLMHQIIFSAIDALFVVGTIAAMVGGVVMVQLIAFSSAFATEQMMMDVLVSIIIREVAPLFTTLILIARSGSAITIELGTMRLKQQDVALDAMGINILKYFHLPRVLGMTISNVILTLYFVLITLASALFISLFREGVDIEGLLFNFIGALSLWDISLCIFKASVLGIIIALVCIFHGLAVGTSPTQIPQQASQALVNSYMICYKLNMVISIIYYLLL